MKTTNHWVVRVFEKNGEPCIRFPRPIVRLFGLRSGDSVVRRKLPRKQAWSLKFYRGQRLLRPRIDQ